MSLYIVDTDTLSFYQHGHAAVNARVAALRPGEFATTILNVEEQLMGRLARLRKARQTSELASAYQRLTDTVKTLSRLQILSFSTQAIARYHQLLALKLKIGKMDLRIGAVALENNGTVVTRNLRDFQRIPNLMVENWAL